MTVRFLVDAQLPPGLADRLRRAGYEAEHVNEIGLGAAPDSEVVRRARETRAVLISKDGDFASPTRSSRRPAVVWIRIGNVTNTVLWRRLEPLLLEIVAALDAGEMLIEVG